MPENDSFEHCPESLKFEECCRKKVVRFILAYPYEQLDDGQRCKLEGLMDKSARPGTEFPTTDDAGAAHKGEVRKTFRASMLICCTQKKRFA